MKRSLVLYHQNSLAYTKEFLLLKEPRELHILFWLIISLMLLSMGIIVFARIDDVVKVGGVVRTQGNVSAVRNVVAGRITNLRYKPGMKVSRGDFLYSIDPASYNAQRENLAVQQENLECRLKGIRQLIQSYKGGRNMVDPANDEAYARFEHFFSRQKELSIQAEIAAQKYRTEESRPVSLRKPRNVQMERLNYEGASSALATYRKEFIEKLYEEEKELSLESERTIQERARLDSQYEYLEVYAPLDGYVQEVSSLNRGDYVESGREVLNIIPNDARNFRVEMQIPPRDMGKIRTDMKVKYRLSAFPYFEYHGAEGRISAIDPDIRSTTDGKGLYYSVYADIDRIEFSNRRGQRFPIRVGLETDVRIVLENNTILMFILKRMDFLY